MTEVAGRAAWWYGGPAHGPDSAARVRCIRQCENGETQEKPQTMFLDRRSLLWTPTKESATRAGLQWKCRFKEARWKKGKHSTHGQPWTIKGIIWTKNYFKQLCFSSNKSNNERERGLRRSTPQSFVMSFGSLSQSNFTVLVRSL